MYKSLEYGSKVIVKHNLFACGSSDASYRKKLKKGQSLWIDGVSLKNRFGGPEIDMIDAYDVDGNCWYLALKDVARTRK